VYCTAKEDGPPISAKYFRQVVVDVFLDGYTAPVVRHGRRSANPPMRLTGRHFVSSIEGKSKPDCLVCSDCTAWKRKQTSYSCKDCSDVPLCVTPCFMCYHTVLDYKK